MTTSPRISVKSEDDPAAADNLAFLTKLTATENGQWCLAPPPEASYADRKSLDKAVDSWLEDCGYDLVTIPQSGPFILLRCSKHARPTGCKMQILIKRHKSGYSIIHRKNISSLHNHPPACRRQTFKLKDPVDQFVLENVSLGVRLQELLDKCSMEFSIKPDMDDMRLQIWNIVRHIGIKPATMAMLQREGCYIRRDNDRLFIAHPAMINHIKVNSVVWQLSSEREMGDKPLLEICPISGNNLPILAAVCVLEANDYLWALQQLNSFMQDHHIRRPRLISIDLKLNLLNAVRTIFPDIHVKLVDRHHITTLINKTFHDPESQTALKSTLEIYDNLSKVLASKSEEEFEQMAHSLQFQWPECYDNLLGRWLKDWKEAAVSAWVNRQLTFGNDSLTRSEGEYKQIWKVLRTSNNLYDLFSSLIPHWQQHAYEVALEAGTVQVKACTTEVSALLRPLLREIWPHAFKVMDKQQQAAETKFSNQESDGIESMLECSCSHAAVTGTPCEHTILRRLNERKPLELNDFDPYWHIKPSEVALPQTASQMIGDSTAKSEQGFSIGRRQHEPIPYKTAREVVTTTYFASPYLPQSPQPSPQHGANNVLSIAPRAAQDLHNPALPLPMASSLITSS